MFVGWKSSGQRTVSRAETVGVGGLFLHTPSPLPQGSFVELLFDLKTGEIRARAVVRHSSPGRGMGVQFVQMQPADRARLHQFLSKFAAAEIDDAPEAGTGAGANPSKPPDEVQFEREMAERLDIARKGTYYQLFGVSPDSSVKQIKESFHAFARKFHPDHHMAKKEWMAPLKEAMAAATIAYKVLSDKDRRATYDSQLADSGAFQLRRTKSVAEQKLDEYFLRATENLRGNNLVGSVVWLRKCVEMAPEEAKYRALLGRSLATIPKYRQEAVEQFERAIELDPLNANVCLELAQLCEELQMAARARKLYAQILAADPLHAKAREKLAALKTNQNA
jgi:tetratricopeptide (TPR) repeat protein